MEFLLALHGWIRWIVLVVGGAALVLAALRKAEPPGRILGSAFLGLLDTQMLLGVVLLVLDDERRASRIPHSLVMGLAVVIAHALRVRLKKRPQAGPAFHVAATAVPFLLILLGLWVLGVKS